MPPLTLIPINPKDRQLMLIMTRQSSPRWLRLAACLAMESRHLVVIKNGFLVADICPACGSPDAVMRGLHKNQAGEDTRALVTCEQCSHVRQDRLLSALEESQRERLAGFREAF